jgi:hypothetical protein
MSSQNFLPDLSPSVVQQAAQVHTSSQNLSGRLLTTLSQLIQQAYSTTQAHVDQRHIQQELVEIQKRPEAWGLIVPFLDHPDPNVQFFGAHTAQVKIMRDWLVLFTPPLQIVMSHRRDSFPDENAELLRELLLKLTSHSILTGKSKMVCRKLFVAVSSIFKSKFPLLIIRRSHPLHSALPQVHPRNGQTG